MYKTNGSFSAELQKIKSMNQCSNVITENTNWSEDKKHRPPPRVLTPRPAWVHPPTCWGPTGQSSDTHSPTEGPQWSTSLGRTHVVYYLRTTLISFFRIFFQGLLDIGSFIFYGLTDWFWREEGKERDNDLLFSLFMHSLVDSHMCPDQRLNPKPWSLGATF